MTVEHLDKPEAAQRAAFAVLGAVFIDPEAYDQVAEIITARDLPDERTRRVFHAMGELRRQGVHVDSTTVLEELERIGGRPEPDLVDLGYLTNIAESAFTAVNVEHHARIVADHARRRSAEAVLRRYADALPQMAVDQVADLVRSCMGELAPLIQAPEAQRPVTLRAACRAFLERGETPAEAYPWPGGALPDVRQGFIGPDMLKHGPTQAWSDLARVASIGPDRLAVLTGLTGRGKTAFGLQVAAAVAEAGHTVLYASAELGADELVARLVAQRAERGTVAWASILSACPDDVRDAVADAGAGNLGTQLHLWTPMGAHRNAGELERVARMLQARLVVVDYVQRFVDDGPEKRVSVAAMSGALRDLSRPRQGWPGAAVLALSSVSRQKYEPFASCKALRDADGDELVGSGKECGELEYDATLVLCLTTDRTGDKREAVLRVVKQRAGIPDAAVGFTFNAPAGRFEPATPKPAPSGQADRKGAPAGRGRATKALKGDDFDD